MYVVGGVERSIRACRRERARDVRYTTVAVYPCVPAYCALHLYIPLPTHSRQPAKQCGSREHAQGGWPRRETHRKTCHRDRQTPMRLQGSIDHGSFRATLAAHHRISAQMSIHNDPANLSHALSRVRYYGLKLGLLLLFCVHVFFGVAVSTILAGLCCRVGRPGCAVLSLLCLGRLVYEPSVFLFNRSRGEVRQTRDRILTREETSRQLV